MAEKGQNLLELIAGRFKPKATAIKSAQAVVTSTVEPNRYRRSVEAMKAEQLRQHQEEAAKAARKTQWPVTSGNEDYDKLPDVARARKAEQIRQMKEDFLASQKDVVQRKPIEQIMREQAGVKTWGSRFGDRLASLFNSLAKMPTVATPGMTPAIRPRKDMPSVEPEVAHDAANNYQLAANAVAQGAGYILRAGSRYLNPTTYGDSIAAQKKRRSYENAQANATAAFNERQRQILDDMQTGLGSRELMGGRGTSTADRMLARLNYGAMAGVGEFIGGEAVTGGAGIVAKGMGRGIQAGSTALGGRAGALAARPLSHSFPRVGSVANRWVSKGITEVGDTLALPFNAVGQLATPGAVTRGTIRTTGQVMRPVAQTGRDLLGMIRHPVRTTQQAAHYTAQHPFRAAGNTVAYPVKQIWQTAKPVAKPVLGMPGLRGYTLYEAQNQARDGQYGRAAATIGTLGAWGAGLVPGALASTAYGLTVPNE